MDYLEVLEQAKKRVNLLDYIVQITGKKAKQVGINVYFINPCPICGHKNHFAVHTDTNSYCSHSKCCKGGSIIDFLIEYEGLSQKDAQIKAIELAGLKYLIEQKNDKKISDENKKEIKNNYDFTSIIVSLSKNKTDYFKSRGFSERLIEKYKLGYSPEGYNAVLKDYPELQNGLKNQYAYKYIIPIWDIDNKCRYFIARKDDKVSNEGNKTINMKGLNVQLFNERYLLDPSLSDRNIFIVEGWADALSFEELGYNSIALNSTSNIRRLINLMDTNVEKIKEKFFIIIGDNDEAGQKMNKELKYEFDKLGINYGVMEIEQYKDVNEYLVNNKEGLKKRISSYLNELYNEDFTITYLKDFFTEINKLKKNKAISTGFKNLDYKLSGGIYSGLYVLGAISSLGKTTLILQIADSIAAQGHDVLFFSLEMSKFELVSRSLVREMFKYDNSPGKEKSVGTRDFMNGKADENLLISIGDSYKNIANHIAIIEGVFNTGVHEIRERINKHCKVRGTKPLVIIDYLQALKPIDYRMNDKQNIDFSIMELKRISRDFDIPIIVISSLNRQNYAIPISFESFKESGAIEYTADVIMGLQLSGIYSLANIKSETEKREKINEFKAADPRDVELVILKNRNGIPYATHQYLYYPKFNYFDEKE